MFQNKFFDNTNKLSANLTQNSDKNKLLNEFKEQTYKDTNKRIVQYVQCIKYVCSGVSVITAFAFFAMFIYLSTCNILGVYVSYILSALIAFVGVFLLENAKTNSINTLSKLFLQYRTIKKELAIIAFLCFSTSILTSYKGAQALPTITATQPQLHNIDSIQAHYTKRIEQAITLGTYKPTNTLTKKGAAIVETLENNRATDVQAARMQNEQATAAASTEIKSLEVVFCAVSLCIELFILLCTFYVVFYRFNCFLEAIANGEDEDEDGNSIISEKTPFLATKQPTAHNPTTATETGQRIGFYDIKQKQCNNCGERFVSNHKKQLYCTDTCRFSFHAKKRKEQQS